MKIGVLGNGNSAKSHLVNWSKIDNVEIAGFYEPTHLVPQKIFEEFSTFRYLNADQLIDSCDLIDITTPADYHYEWCEKAIRKGKHVFAESTLTYSVEEVKQLVKLIKESNVKFQIGYIERFNPAFAVLQQLHPNPTYIEAYNTTASKENTGSQNTILDLMNSDIDIILSIVKSDVKNIIATGVNVTANGNDIINARIQFNNGCDANITAGGILSAPTHEMRFYEPGKIIDINFITRKTKTFNQEDNNIIEQGSPENGETNMMKIQLEEFKNTILNNASTIATATDGFKAMEITNQILQKIKNSH